MEKGEIKVPHSNSLFINNMNNNPNSQLVTVLTNNSLQLLFLLHEI